MDDFLKLDIIVGQIVEVNDFPEAKKHAYQLKINLGEPLGIKLSSAQLTHHYTKEQLLGKYVLCITNLPPRKIAHFTSEVLTLGVPDEQGQCVLVSPDKQIPLGGKLY